MLKRVLVLDNDLKILEVMEEALVYEGFCVNIFEETDDIISLINQYNPDILIIDYILKGANGGELCKKIKTNVATCQLPVIIFSAYPKIVQSIGYYDCNAFLAKPFDLSVMIDLVKELIADHNDYPFQETPHIKGDSCVNQAKTGKSYDF